MKEKELRLALVCYGGISLAVYMHGVTKEVLKLVRASKVYHSVADIEARADVSFVDDPDRDHREFDTEEVYLDLLKDIGKHLDLRIIVDVLTGASAGGINALILGRALAHDLSLLPLREMWLNMPDVTNLLSPERRAKPWSKWFIRPIVWLFAYRKLAGFRLDREVRQKLSIFLRSRWFQTPFDGKNLITVLYRAFGAMRGRMTPGESLLPKGLKLDLFIAVTDFYGYRQNIQIHTPPVVSEREHRHMFHFHYQQTPGGVETGNFSDDNLWGLAFAARATSSYPGAFPAARLSEIDALTDELGLTWERRSEFLDQQFTPYKGSGLNPERIAFVDGAVLNNKPFKAAVDAIVGRPAYREVDRRIVYIDPHPPQLSNDQADITPGFFRNLKGSLSDIPRNEPIFEDLAWIDEHNHDMRRLKAVIEGTRPRIDRLVEEATRSFFEDLPPGFHLEVAQVRHLRENSNTYAAQRASYAYEGYLRVKLSGVVGNVGELISDLCGFQGDSPERNALMETLHLWATQRDIYPNSWVPSLNLRELSDSETPSWVRFLLDFDVEFRQRRLRFLVREINSFYARSYGDAPSTEGLATGLDELKMQLYGLLERLQKFRNGDFLSPACRELIVGHCSNLKDFWPGNEATGAPMAAVAQEIFPRFDEIVEHLAAEAELSELDAETDRLFAALGPKTWTDTLRRTLLVNYVGFAFWDVLIFSITNWRHLEEYDEIKVDRVSPEDCHTLASGSGVHVLDGIKFGHFGAFFSRRYRENDYLWGRLHGIDRLVDIVCDAVATEVGPGCVDMKAIKKRAFLKVLEAEETHLGEDAGLLARLRVEIEAL